MDSVSKKIQPIKTGLGVGKTILCALLSFVYMCIKNIVKAKSVIVLSPLDIARNNMLSLVSKYNKHKYIY